jgi:hypothetical protein
MADIDTHIKFDGVDGEATHKDHKGEIEVLSWGWNVTNANIGGTSGGGSGKGKATPGDFNVRARLRQGVAGSGKDLRQWQALRDSPFSPRARPAKARRTSSRSR